MKIFYSLFISVFVLFILNQNLYGQCTPSTLCIDTENPGEFCPDTLPDATVNIPYVQVVTIIPPAEFDLGTGPIPLHHIRLDTVLNLPPGITYTKYDNAMYPYTSYCVDIEGTCDVIGSWPLTLKITPFITILGTPVATSQVVDDTSLTLNVVEASGNYIESLLNNEPKLIPSPNPFSEEVSLVYKNSVRSDQEIRVFDLLGNVVYYEKFGALSGLVDRNINLAHLKKGIYYLTLKNRQHSYTVQIVKM